AAAAFAVLLAAGLAGCSAADTGVVEPPANSSTDGSAPDSSEGNDGRAFDSTDDAVITAILAALGKADGAEWQGTNLRINFPEGSVSDPTARIGCLAAQTLIADDETAFMVYPDGE